MRNGGVVVVSLWINQFQGDGSWQLLQLNVRHESIILHDSQSSQVGQSLGQSAMPNNLATISLETHEVVVLYMQLTLPRGGFEKSIYWTYGRVPLDRFNHFIRKIPSVGVSIN